MGLLRTSKAGLDPTFGLIAMRLRDETEDLMVEALPDRWIEILHRFNEQEKTREGIQGERHGESTRDS